MPIQVECSSCGQEIRAKEEFAGRKVRCPNCKSAITLPEPDVPVLQEDLEHEDEPEPEPERRRPPPKRTSRPRSTSRQSKSRSKSERIWYLTYWQWLVGAALLVTAPFTLFFVGLAAVAGLLLVLIGGIAPALRVLVGDPGTALTMVLSRSARWDMMNQPDSHPYKVLCRNAFKPTRGFFFRGLVLLLMCALSLYVHGAMKPGQQGGGQVPDHGFRMAEPIAPPPVDSPPAVQPITLTGDPNQILHMKLAYQKSTSAGPIIKQVLADYPSIIADTIEIEDSASSVRFQFRGKFDEHRLLIQLQNRGIGNLTISSGPVPPP